MINTFKKCPNKHAAVFSVGWALPRLFLVNQFGLSMSLARFLGIKLATGWGRQRINPGLQALVLSCFVEGPWEVTRKKMPGNLPEIVVGEFIQGN